PRRATCGPRIRWPERLTAMGTRPVRHASRDELRPDVCRRDLRAALGLEDADGWAQWIHPTCPTSITAVLAACFCGPPGSKDAGGRSYANHRTILPALPALVGGHFDAPLGMEE